MFSLLLYVFPGVYNIKLYIVPKFLLLCLPVCLPSTPVHPYLSSCLPVYQPICLSLYLSIHLSSVYLSVDSFIYLTMHLCIYLCLSIHLSALYRSVDSFIILLIHLSIDLSIYRLSIHHLSTYLSVHPSSIYLSVYRSIHDDNKHNINDKHKPKQTTPYNASLTTRTQA